MAESSRRDVVAMLRTGTVPEAVKRSLSKGVYPLGPAQMLEALILLSAEGEYRADAVASLRKVPGKVVLGVCASQATTADLLFKLAKLFSRKEEFLEKIVLNPSCDDATMVFAAGLPFPGILEIIGRNHGRMTREPRIAAALKSNAATPANVLLLWEEEEERRRRADARRKEKHDAREEEEADGLPAVLIEEIEEGGHSGGDGGASAAAVEEKKKTIQQILRDMTAGQKVALANKGNAEVRKILVRDKNRLVCQKVLENPRITDSEVEHYAKSTNVAEDVLRAIGSRREWVKLRQVVRALVQNPKTPLGLSMHHLKSMSVREMEGLSKNRNIPETLRREALKLFKLKKERSGR